MASPESADGQNRNQAPCKTRKKTYILSSYNGRGKREETFHVKK